jgi:serine/threonine protein kinase
MLEATTRLSTNYIQTRPYRAPELLLNSPKVGTSTDMWAVGCILGDMLNRGQVLFDGCSTQDQICKIIQLMGTPLTNNVHASKAGLQFLEQLEFVQPNPEWYLDVFPRGEVDPLALDLLGRLLQFDSEKRISAKEALSHPFFKPLYHMRINYKPFKFNFDFEKELVVHDGEENNIITYGNLVKKACYNSILISHGLFGEAVVHEIQDLSKTKLKKKLFARVMAMLIGKK